MRLNKCFYSYFVFGVLALLTPNFSLAQSTSNVLAASFPIYAAATSMNMVFSNPPLPMLDNPEKAHRFSLMPFMFDGLLNRNESEDGGMGSNPSGGCSGPAGCTSSTSNALRTGSFKGFGFAASYNRNISKRWSFFTLAMGSNLNGDFLRTGEPIGNTQANITRVSGTNASYYMLGTSFVYHSLRSEGSRLAWSLFLGPTITKADIRGKVLETKSASNGSGVVSDFDMQAGATMPGLLVGGQLGIDIGTSFRVIPFAILGGSFGDTSVQATTRTNNSSTLITAINRGETFAIGSGGGNAGIHIEYRPWGFALNVTAPFLKKPLFVEYDGKGVEVNEISASVSWPTSFATSSPQQEAQPSSEKPAEKSSEPKEEKPAETTPNENK